MKHRRASRWVEATLNAVATPVFIIRIADRTVLFVNREAAKIVGPDATGLTVDRAFGLDGGALVTDADGHPIAMGDGPIGRAERGEQVGPLEVAIHAADRTAAYVCFAERAAPGRNRGAVVLSLFDVTELRRVQRELARVEERRDEFVALSAHELRTPLTCLRLQMDVAARKHPELSFVVALRHAVDRMSKRVDQLVDVVEMREHVVVLHPESADLREIAREGAHLLEAEATWACSRVTIAPGPPIVGRWDRRRLVQVVNSLVSNAVKFGAGKPVELVPRDDGEAASLSVIDHGAGVAPADREVIFERFQRRASAAHFAGLGLDLWITLELLHEMGGTIEVGETPGGGATFTFRVPKLIGTAAVAPPLRRASDACP